jgi:hypothetical protein
VKPTVSCELLRSAWPPIIRAQPQSASVKRRLSPTKVEQLLRLPMKLWLASQREMPTPPTAWPARLSSESP